MQRILVWDLPTRVGHWLLATAFLVAYLTGEREAWRLVHHMWAGGIVAGVVVFRVVWGLVGTRHARFEAFVRAPRAAFDYLCGLARRNARHYTGHNPAGGWAILLLLALGLTAAVSGWLAYQDAAGEWLGDAHELIVDAMLAVVILHIAGVLVGSLAHRENLARAMVTGYKQGVAGEAIGSIRPWAVVLLLACAAGGGWWLSL